MRAGQTLVAQDGYEVALFPMPYLYMTQDEGGNYSHQGTYNLDFSGWGPNGKVYQAPMYAPCTMKLLHFWTALVNGNMQVWESTQPVHLANGQLDYLTLVVAHDNNPPYASIGTIVRQGILFYHTGTYYTAGGTGDHVHTCLGQGQYQGFTERPGGHEDLTNRIHYWDGVYVNDTTVVQGYGHNWIEWVGPTPPTPSGEILKKFPWVLYARKLRENRS